MPTDNIHASAVLLGDRGVVISGPSGSGKTTLALALLDRFNSRGIFSRLVCDDQILVRTVDGRVICNTPEPIAGLIEVFGLGPRQIGHEARMIADLLVQLVPYQQAERFPEPAHGVLAGCQISRLQLAAGSAASATQAVAAWLAASPFG
ncbi:HPr kinase/phosphorylase [Mesorhizobium sp. NBSH29]|uniref:HPr kinase/phosphorylase n=1 Tax=Mesorhizobium sp. NBSH29 TaxID=2654249 RepID=UPI0018969BA6|nr:HPr kinase/phosphorylase [Mesorhizobium sp. NBSH29]QPC86100.1 HPr kinase/phosphorylase [Mesorhizobium sp. NBSH29]